MHDTIMYVHAAIVIGFVQPSISVLEGDTLSVELQVVDGFTEREVFIELEYLPVTSESETHISTEGNYKAEQRTSCIHTANLDFVPVEFLVNVSGSGASFSIPISSDDRVEGPELFTVRLLCPCQPQDVQLGQEELNVTILDATSTVYTSSAHTSHYV